MIFPVIGGPVMYCCCQLSRASSFVTGSGVGPSLGLGAAVNIPEFKSHRGVEEHKDGSEL